MPVEESKYYGFWGSIVLDKRLFHMYFPLVKCSICPDIWILEDDFWIVNHQSNGICFIF